MPLGASVAGLAGAYCCTPSAQLSFSRVVALQEEGLCVFPLLSACACDRVVKDTKITMVDTSTIIEGTVKFRDGKKVRILSFSNF